MWRFSFFDPCEAWKPKVLYGEAPTFSIALILGGFTVTMFHAIHHEHLSLPFCFILYCYCSVSSGSGEGLSCCVPIPGSEVRWLRRESLYSQLVITSGLLRRQLAARTAQQLSRFLARLLLQRRKERQRDICRHASCGQNCEVESLPFVPEPSFLKSFLCPQLRVPFYFFSGSQALLSLLIPAFRGKILSSTPFNMNLSTFSWSLCILNFYLSVRCRFFLPWGTFQALGNK